MDKVPSEWPSQTSIFTACISVDKHYSKKNSWKPGRRRIYASSKSRNAEESLVLQLQDKARRANISKPFDFPMQLLCCLLVDNFLTKKGKLNLKAGDSTNIIQGVEDALQKAGIIRDDALITEHTIIRRRGENGILLMLLPDENYSGGA